MPLNVLIVDDSPVMRTFVKRIVQRSGIEVDRYLEAGNGAEALEIASVEPVQAIFTDVNMPVMDGEELVRRLRADPDFAGTPVIVISTDATVARIENMMALGASGYVQKPFGPEQLRDEVDRIFGGEPDSPAVARTAAERAAEGSDSSRAAGEGAQAPGACAASGSAGRKPGETR
jgi:two-component system chemotaxis response regulator CheY